MIAGIIRVSFLGYRLADAQIKFARLGVSRRILMQKIFMNQTVTSFQHSATEENLSFQVAIKQTQYF